MRTSLIVLIGFALLGLVLGAVRLFKLPIETRRMALLGFMIGWSVLCLGNVIQGIRLGHDAKLELVVLALTLIPPVLTAWRLRRRS